MRIYANFTPAFNIFDSGKGNYDFALCFILDDLRVWVGDSNDPDFPIDPQGIAHIDEIPWHDDQDSFIGDVEQFCILDVDILVDVEFVDIRVNLLLELLIAHDLQVPLSRDGHLEEVDEDCPKALLLLSAVDLEGERSCWFFEDISGQDLKDSTKSIGMFEYKMAVGVI